MSTDEGQQQATSESRSISSRSRDEYSDDDSLCSDEHEKRFEDIEDHVKRRRGGWIECRHCGRQWEVSDSGEAYAQHHLGRRHGILAE